MNRSILTALLAITMGAFPLSINAQLYVADEASGFGSQTETWIDAGGQKERNVDPFKVNERVVWVQYPNAYINEPNHRSYNIEWMDGSYTLYYPVSCVVAPNTTPAQAIEHLNSDSSPTVASSASNSVFSGPLNGVILNHHMEPVNKTGNMTAVSLFLPGTVACDSGLGEITATVSGFSNVQKWWDGGTPNWRRTTQTFRITYKPLVTISAEFSPPTISMTGVVNTYVENRTDLIVTTSGGTKVVIEWPEVNKVEYEQTGVWVKGHTQSVSVADGANLINKRIRVRSSEAGTSTINVPVTMTIS